MKQIFNCLEMKILDLYDCPEEKRGPGNDKNKNIDDYGRWEAYFPLSDFATFNVLKK